MTFRHSLSRALCASLAVLALASCSDGGDSPSHESTADPRDVLDAAVADAGRSRNDPFGIGKHDKTISETPILALQKPKERSRPQAGRERRRNSTRSESATTTGPPSRQSPTTTTRDGTGRLAHRTGQRPSTSSQLTCRPSSVSRTSRSQKSVKLTSSRESRIRTAARTVRTRRAPSIRPKAWSR